MCAAFEALFDHSPSGDGTPSLNTSLKAHTDRFQLKMDHLLQAAFKCENDPQANSLLDYGRRRAAFFLKYQQEFRDQFHNPQELKQGIADWLGGWKVLTNDAARINSWLERAGLAGFSITPQDLVELICHGSRN
jgi:hypothetical protein